MKKLLVLLAFLIAMPVDARSGGSMGGGSFSSRSSSSFGSSRSSFSTPSRSYSAPSSFSSTSYSRPSTTFTYSRPSTYRPTIYTAPIYRPVSRWSSPTVHYSYSPPIVFHSYDTHYYSSPYSNMYFWHGPVVAPVPVGTSHGDVAAFFTIVLIIMIIGGVIWFAYAYYNRDRYYDD